MVRVIRDGRMVWQAPCSTAANGPGFEKDSLKTPLGWHSVAEKIGDGAPWGSIFRSKKPADETWTPGKETDEDLVLTRILSLAGEEPGKNKGGNVDSYDRCIYFHGTNVEDRIGTPASHGCIRLTNDDVIAAYERIPLEAPVLITE
jgi:lipoprotein-anchoring transpeptidase ErfK/SrfK